MTRVRVIVEGQTEESFIKNVLAPSLWHRDIHLLPMLLGVPGHKGGNVNYARVRKDILLQLKQEQTAYCSTMFDLYGLGAGFPGLPASANLKGSKKAEHIEQAMLRDIRTCESELRSDVRFLPYLQVHEYEGLLFSDPEALAAALGRDNLSNSFKEIRASFETPEDINEDPDTAPSKQLRKLSPGYQKRIEGTSAAQKIGVETILRECPHFRSWVERLSGLAPLRSDQ